MKKKLRSSGEAFKGEGGGNLSKLSEIYRPLLLLKLLSQKSIELNFCKICFQAVEKSCEPHYFLEASFGNLNQKDIAHDMDLPGS